MYIIIDYGVNTKFVNNKDRSRFDGLFCIQCKQMTFLQLSKKTYLNSNCKKRSLVSSPPPSVYV